MRRGLDRLRTEKAVNVSAWLRRLVHQALQEEFPDGKLDDLAPDPPDAPAEPDDDLAPDPQKPPVEGWTPRQLDQGWGAVLEGAQVADLSESDQLRGTPIVVTDRRGDAWTHDPHGRRQQKRHPRSWSPIPAGRAGEVTRTGVSNVGGRETLPPITAL